MIQLKDISIGYSTSLLSSDGLKLDQGQVSVLIGKNGSGKTTLLHTILNEIPLLEGEILLQERSIKGINSQELARLIAFVPSTFPSTAYIKSVDYVSLGRSPYTNAFGRNSKADIDIINNAFIRLDIDHLKDRYTSSLSDGEKQLVAIAKAITQSTPVIILDEPLAFLDYANRKNVLIKLNKLAKSENKCILFSSHDMDIIMEHDFSFLLVDDLHKKIIQKQHCTKQEIIDICFPA